MFGFVISELLKSFERSRGIEKERKGRQGSRYWKVGRNGLNRGAVLVTCIAMNSKHVLVPSGPESCESQTRYISRPRGRCAERCAHTWVPALRIPPISHYPRHRDAKQSSIERASPNYRCSILIITSPSSYPRSKHHLFQCQQQIDQASNCPPSWVRVASRPHSAAASETQVSGCPGYRHS